MNIHIVQDQSFTLHFKRDYLPFSACENKFVFLSKTKIALKDEQYVWVKDVASIIDLIKNTKSVKNIFIHYLTPEVADIVLHFKGKFTFICCFYGGEAFNLPEFENDLFQPATFEWYKKNYNRWGSFPYLNKVGIRQYIRKKLFYETQLNKVREAFNVFHFFCHYLESDLAIIKNKLGINPVFLPFTYGSLEDYSLESQIVGENILVGNSADFSNNHTEVFQVLANLDLGKRKIYVPLSYPKNLANTYVKWVVEQGKYYLGNNFMPLLEFMPLEAYMSLINTCSDVMMNHNRSQAGGNNMTAIFNGAKLYLNPKNTLYQHYKDLDIEVFSLSDANNFENISISKEQKSKNRTHLISFFGREAHLERYRNIVKMVE